MNRRDSPLSLPLSSQNFNRLHHSNSSSLSDAYHQTPAMLAMSTNSTDLLSSPPDSLHNVSDDRIHPQHRRLETFETTEDGDVLIVRSAFDDGRSASSHAGSSGRNKEQQHSRSLHKHHHDWQARSPRQEDGKDGSTEQRNPSSPLDTDLDVSSSSHHTRNLSAHFFDATTIARSGSLDSADMYKGDEFPSEQGRKHRLMLSNGSIPGVAHRRLNSMGTSAHVDRRGGTHNHFHHAREHSAGLDILSAAVVDVSKDELAQAAGTSSSGTGSDHEQQQQHRGGHERHDRGSSLWERQLSPPPQASHQPIPYDQPQQHHRPVYPPPSPSSHHSISASAAAPSQHSMQPPHTRRYNPQPPPPSSYMHGTPPGRPPPPQHPSMHYSSHHGPYGGGYPHPAFYSPSYLPPPPMPRQHSYGGPPPHEYPSQHSMYPTSANAAASATHKSPGTMYPPETRTRATESGRSMSMTSHKTPMELLWTSGAPDSNDSTAASGLTHLGSQSFGGPGRSTALPSSSSKRHSYPSDGLDIPSRMSHHRKMSSFSSIGLGTVFGTSVLSPDGENDTHPLMCAPTSRQAAHHRSTSSTVSFMNVLDVAGMAGTADETFLRNLQESSDADFRTPTPCETSSGAAAAPAATSAAAPVGVLVVSNTDASSSTTAAVADAETAQNKLASGGSNKRIRRKCTVAGCVNRVVQGGLCISHGAKRKICGHPGCNKNVKKAGLCSTHGPARKRCETPGCQKVAVQGGKCIAHGAKKRLCEVESCNKQAILGGMCKKHHDRRRKSTGSSSGGAAGSAGSGGNGTAENEEDASEDSDESATARAAPVPSSAAGSKSRAATATASKKASPGHHKHSHTRGLSIFHDISADAVQSLLNAETVVIPPPPTGATSASVVAPPARRRHAPREMW